MAKKKKVDRIPKTDSIQKLAEFWDTHDLTDYEDELEEVTEPIFVRKVPVKVMLSPKQAKSISQIAQSKGVSEEKLIRDWVLEKLRAS